ncbi:MAG: acetyl-CoA carboxylase, biotin carboxyl carrier protein [Tissierellia bacterium]|nr:acetyl-CoA carboxylase, biotin carboxyl carrier protein [Tissierellia bacterium]
MDTKEIIDILNLFSRKSLTKLIIKKDGFTLEMEKGNQGCISTDVEEREVPRAETKFDESTDYRVKSPLVGVFYEAPSPESKPFVKLGDSVDKGEVICIIEAMKMINEIKAPVSGVIKRINFKNEELVQYDDVIMEIEEYV